MAFPRFWFYRAILKIAGAVCLRYDLNKYAAGPATANGPMSAFSNLLSQHANGLSKKP